MNNDKNICGDEQAKLKPSHYNSGDKDLINFCMENNIDFMAGNIMKYLMRWKKKNGIEDLKKAKEYLERLIKKEENDINSTKNM